METENGLKICPFCGQMQFIADEEDQRPEMHCTCDQAVKYQKAAEETERLNLAMLGVCGEHCGEKQPGMEPVSDEQRMFLNQAVQAVGMGYVGKMSMDLLDGTLLTLTESKVKRTKKVELEQKK